MSESAIHDRQSRTDERRDASPALLEPGAHACLVYDDPDERIEAAVPFVRSGLGAGERVLCVLDSGFRDELRAALADLGIDADEAEGAALVYLDPDEYAPPGPFEPTAMLDGIGERVRRARDEGFGGARLLVDMAWAVQAALTDDDVLAYERLSNHTFFPDTEATALCMYPADDFDTEMLDGVVGAHPWTVVDQDATPNPLYRLDGKSAGNGGPGVWERLGWIEPTLRRAAQAERLLEELDEADRRRDEFLAMLAHELRNPLAGISNAGAVLEERAGSDPDLRKVADVIERQVGYLSVMLDDLLDLLRITRDEVELDREKVRLHEIVSGAVRTAEPWAEAGGVGLDTELPRDPVYLEADAARLERALVKVIGNAVDHSSEGDAVRVVASVDGEEVAIAVRDEGTGIEPELLPRIFDPFIRGGRARPGRRPGLGVGLAIVKHAVELHGGRVEARSDGPGTGAEFTIRVPLGAPPGRPDEAEAPGPRSKTDAAPAARILVVDDDRDSVDLLKDLLGAWGYEADVAYDGQEALEAVERNSPDVVFLDLGLPRLDGLAVARRIRERWGPDSPTLIAMTGYGRPQDMEQTREAGFERHLVKPVSVSTVRELLDRHG